MERVSLGSLAAGMLRLGKAGALPSNTIVVGQVIALSGLMATTGANLALGAKVYFDYINSTGGVHGRKIHHTVLDDGHRVEDTVRLTRELLARPEVVALFGFGGTMNISRLLADGVLAQGGAPLVAPYTGGEPLRNPFNPWIFHLRAGYMDEADRMVHRAFEEGRRRFALMCSADALGRAGLEAVQAALAKRGLRLHSAGSFERNTELVEHAVDRIITAHADAVVMFSTNRTTAAFARQYRAAGGQADLYNVSLIDVPEVVELAGSEAVRGMVVTQVVPSPHMLSLPAVREFHNLVERFARGQRVNYANFEAFLGAKLLVEGLRRAGASLSRKHLMAALVSVNDFDLGGITVGYSPRNRVGSRRIDITVVGDKGQLVNASQGVPA